MYEHRTERRIEFADTDMAGIVHFARFFVFMESAEHELLARLGTPVHFQHEGREVGWPRLAASCTYHSPARFGDVLAVRVRVLRKGTKSMTYAVDFRYQRVPHVEGNPDVCDLQNDPECNSPHSFNHGWSTPIAQHFIYSAMKAFPDRDFVLIGHSLGVTIIRDALRRLLLHYGPHSDDKSFNPYAQLDRVILLSGGNRGVSSGCGHGGMTGKDSCWAKACRKHQLATKLHTEIL